MSDAHLTPVFRQWRELKQQHPGCLLLFHMGDFYELFEEDAEIAARALELTLTSRESGKGQRIAMCGVPCHALERYLTRLVKLGYHAAIAEQAEDPRFAKGLVRREVSRVVTPGTLTEETLLEARRNNYLVALADAPQEYGLAVADVSTGDFRVTGFQGPDARRGLLEELERLAPAELLWPFTLQSGAELRAEAEALLGHEVTVTSAGTTATRTAAERLCQHFGVAGLQGFGLDDRPLLVEAAASLLDYVYQTQRSAARQMVSLATYSTAEHMHLDPATRRNLELVATLRDGATGPGTLLGLLDATLTPMGARLLRGWLIRPLTRSGPIHDRLDAVACFHTDALRREDLRTLLRSVADVERLVAKAVTGRALPRDLVALRQSLQRLPELRRLLAESPAARPTALAGEVADLSELSDLLAAALVDEPPANLKDGGYLRAGYSADLDGLRQVGVEGREWIAGLETRERETTGIASLKVGFNQVFGYYLEVTRSNLGAVPERYQRKQTLANGERYITPELKEWETRILAAEERLSALELQLFNELRAAVADHAPALLATARALAEADVYAALAHVAAQRGFTRPAVNDGECLTIRAGRHPIVEATQAARSFVPNDTELDTQQSQIHIVTGPNMAGKSTYLRQVALIVLMAQIGSFVPAERAEIGTVDRIFTRVGAQDDLATGQSTFMVEMTETANILHNATRRSLVVLDEIGRGTSTYDGLSIAWAVVEYLHDRHRVGAKTLFATHYHYLNELEQRLERVRNYRVAVAEEGERVLFLHRIEPGGTDRSYGIEVARLAGLPVWVTERAREVLGELERQSDGGHGISEARPVQAVQLKLFDERGPHPVLGALRAVDVMRLTPIEAITKLHELQQLAQREE
ncbi:MAG: DNA mismatch repair protein MutS [Armatimonadetes bacterium]|nr:DNA mismatch repair protein MutS [Armatimonadota bacterium]